MGLLSFIKSIFKKQTKEEVSSIIQPPVTTPDPVVVDTEQISEVVKAPKKRAATKTATKTPAKKAIKVEKKTV